MQYLVKDIPAMYIIYKEKVGKLEDMRSRRKGLFLHCYEMPKTRFHHHEAL